MNLYRINIRSVGNGWTDNKLTEGEVTETKSGVIVKYPLDGDECILTVDGGKVTQQRTGGQFVKITFEEGAKTQCTIGSGGLSGSYEIFTRSLKFISGKGGYKLSLEYLNGSEGEIIKLTLTAVKKGKNYEN